MDNEDPLGSQRKTWIRLSGSSIWLMDPSSEADAYGEEGPNGHQEEADDSGKM